MKLIATNIKNTLVDDQNHFDYQKFQKIMDQMKSKGIHFVVISSDNYPHLLRFFNSIDGQISFVCENGAQVVKNGVVLKNHLVDYLTCQRVFKYLSKDDQLFGANIILSGKNNAYTNLKASDPKFKQQKQFYDYLQHVPDITAVFDQIYRIHLEWQSGDDATRIQLINHHFPDLRAVSNINGGIDIITEDSSREDGLKALQASFKVNDAEVAILSSDDNDQNFLNQFSNGISTKNQSIDGLDQINQLIK
ncbi:hypothetical protein WR164_05370 [Philodulcilactobacillus myokoensis]|uniref:Uncharacterized protein n=1 Tax=Philodulcilactobacillus myokoensis TaxID=2929573 RepID=A0A9W6B1A2_9LACO|nr:HAD hydrolase family protein [Philodulcilactobacillus myokoensis]GLB46558.1 hypothetical protein WR164_05370 [Philodulcilactobacillus myokoensis]